MITIKVHLTLDLNEIIGQREMEISLPQGSTVEFLVQHMLNRSGKDLSSHLFDSESNRLFPHIRLLINGEEISSFKGMNHILADGDEVLIGDEVLLFRPWAEGNDP